MIVGHTVQDNINSQCDNKLWRVDVGISGIFNTNNMEVLEILDDKVCNKLIAPYVGRWKEVEGIGENAKMDAGFLG